MNMRDLIPWGRSRSPSVRGDEVTNPVLALHRDMNRLFDDFFRGFETRLPALGSGVGWGWPNMDVVETDKEYRVTAELPGLEEKDVEVTVHEGVLTLKGEKRVESGNDGDALYRERFYGRFQRSIPVGSDVDADKITASFKNGELTVILPKTEDTASKAKRIPINAR